MGFRALIAALVGAGIGMVQFLALTFMDASNGGFLPKGDFAYFLFSLTWLAEMFALIVIAMYRFSPWIARLLRDDWEVSRILRDKRSHVSVVEWVSMIAIVGRVVVRAIDSGHIVTATFVGVAFASAPLIVPRPKPVTESNKSVQTRPTSGPV